MTLRNMGGFDRILRFVLGAGLIALPFVQPELVATQTLETAAFVVGGILTVTGLVGMCPLYTVLRINTRKA